MPPDFLLPAGVYICTKRSGEELAAEADAENGPGVLQCVFDEAHFIPEEGEFILFVDALRAAHDDQASGIADLFGHGLAFKGADVTGGDGSPAQGIGNNTEILATMMLDNANMFGWLF